MGKVKKVYLASINNKVQKCGVFWGKKKLVIEPVFVLFNILASDNLEYMLKHVNKTRLFQ